MTANKDILCGYNKRLQPVANKLRKEMTKAEAYLWKYGVAREIERVIDDREPPPTPASGGQRGQMFSNNSRQQGKARVNVFPRSATARDSKGKCFPRSATAGDSEGEYFSQTLTGGVWENLIGNNQGERGVVPRWG